MNTRAYLAELLGTFLFFAIGLTSVQAVGALGAAAPLLVVVPLAFGLGLLAAIFAFGHISGGHFNPAVTLGLIAGGRVAANSAVGYIVAQCLGAIAACTVFATIGRAPPTFAANGYDALSMTRTGMLSVFLIETVLTAFLVFVMMGATNRRAQAGFAPIALGVTLAAIHIMAIPISNASVNPARSLGSAIFGGTTALGQVWLFWVAPILGGVIGGVLARWLQEE
jgi:aquaporin Z